MLALIMESMQSTIELDVPNGKKRKAPRACSKCKSLKKRCYPSAWKEGGCCRCWEEGRECSLAPKPNPPPITHASPAANIHNEWHPGEPVSRSQSTNRATGLAEACSPEADERAPLAQGQHAPGADIQGHRGSPGDVILHESPILRNFDSQIGNGQELRYVNMLRLAEGASSNQMSKESDGPSSRLISGTNPLSALLRKDLKHKIVNSTCSFRTPDPSSVLLPSGTLKPSMGVHNYDWVAQYRSRGLPEVRMSYLQAMGCFELPPLVDCARLLEVYFSRVHLLLPIVSRKDFLSKYFGMSDLPPLILIHAIFLAASRYDDTEYDKDADRRSEKRSHCDTLHAKLRALLEADMCSDRLAIVQSTLLASLHWEGREGTNSAIDNLSIAIRICQDMGLHRSNGIVEAGNSTRDEGILRRVWWSAFALDRLNAAQEGTPFIINELDCDLPPLTAEDFQDEEPITQSVMLINLSLAQLVQGAVRTLYAPTVDTARLISANDSGELQSLISRSEQLRRDIISQLGVDQVIPNIRSDVAALWSALLLTQYVYNVFPSLVLAVLTISSNSLDAVNILIYRPFLSLGNLSELKPLNPRELCRSHALSAISRLEALAQEHALMFSWPFTVYATVNCMLIIWYDLTSPTTSESPHDYSQAMQTYDRVIELLRVMGDVWWAAAAKHKLGEALAVAAQQTKIRCQPGQNSNGAPGHTDFTQDSETHSSTTVIGLGNPTSMPSSAMDDRNFWAQMGLDFYNDVAGSIYTMLPIPEGSSGLDHGWQ